MPTFPTLCITGKLDLKDDSVKLLNTNVNLTRGKILLMSSEFTVITFLKIDLGHLIHFDVNSNWCAGLNPLSRTIQGNDLGTTACPPCAG